MTSQQAQRLRLRAVEERRSITEFAGRMLRLRREARDDPQLLAILSEAADSAADTANSLDLLYTALQARL